MARKVPAANSGRSGVNGKQTAIGAYLRVSSATQSAAMQRAAIEQAANARGDDVGHWYEDRFTGGGARPPALVDMLAHGRAGLFTKLYVYRLDRLSRRGIRDTLEIVHSLEGFGVELVTLADGFDLNGPARDVVLAVLAWAAQWERQAIGERISAARRRIEANGGTWGRPSAVTPSLVKQAKKLRDRGKTAREISAALKVPRATIWRALSRKGVPKGGIKKALPRRV